MDVNNCQFSGRMVDQPKILSDNYLILRIHNNQDYKPQNSNEWIKKNCFPSFFAVGKQVSHIIAKQPLKGDTVLIESRYEQTEGKDGKRYHQFFITRFKILKRKIQSQEPTSQETSTSKSKLKPTKDSIPKTIDMPDPDILNENDLPF